MGYATHFRMSAWIRQDGVESAAAFGFQRQ
ncbi:hypothetical protein B0I32_116269 [Nonomuraea fuscirosea]|uniref:Uncharacterized protein n=1 Tax=Nonomuraea fuscirosea TaxID=1291556 RepID=A0A2T0MRK9_9ACTN|nr:hypothetical protein B0I32_116269 [Nonomuraea fuscirosea]